MKIGVIGCGYVGLTTGVCLAELGHRVICVDSDTQKINLLINNKLPIYEPGIDKLLNKNRTKIRFSTEIKDAVLNNLVVFIAVGTPSNPDGSADLTYVENVVKEIAFWLDDYK
ncbi:MAG: UDP-glucose 6-dehydrogenase, partial [Endomicrobia bacterium]|nr:UDP-glucose 6-dehydrogenase [Endomicrobiia bacterium]